MSKMRWSLVGLLAGAVVAAPLLVMEARAAGDKYKLVSVPETDKKIQRLWKAKCGSCHGQDGKAQTSKGKEMKINDYTVAAWQTARDNAQLRKAIVEGVKAERDGVKQEMDGYKGELKDDQIDALVQHIRFLGAPK